jgi:ribonucleoside-diphosphate reductase beta chain
VFADNSFPWTSQAMDLNKGENFFETGVIEYQNGGSLAWD